LHEAKKPLAIFGEGAAYAQAEEEVNKFVEETHLPVITSPMGKVKASSPPFFLSPQLFFILLENIYL